MAVFTKTSKKKLSWVAPEVNLSSEAYYLLISDTFFLDIGGGFKLVATPENAPTNWDTTMRSKYTWPATPTDTTDKLLEIADGYYLNIGSDFNLLAGTGERALSNWTPITKTR